MSPSELIVPFQGLAALHDNRAANPSREKTRERRENDNPPMPPNGGQIGRVAMLDRPSKNRELLSCHGTGRDHLTIQER